MMSTNAKLLAIDDQPGILALLDKFARRFDFEVITRTEPRSALAELPSIKPDVVIVDLMMPGITGLEVLRAIREAERACQVILMTGHPSVDTAIEAVKLGALDYLSKPLDLPRLGTLLTSARKSIERRERLLRVDAGVAKTFSFGGIVGRSPAMQELFDHVRRLAPHVRTVLITGETGTGK
jgi:DNA-binding NtrC family response regulator